LAPDMPESQSSALETRMIA